MTVTPASREVPVVVGLRLFLPACWTSNAARLDRAGVPEELRPYRTKPEIARATPLRQGVSERGLAWAVGIPFKQKDYPADVSIALPVANRGRPRKNAISDTTSVSAQAMLERAPWRKVSWRRGTKGKLSVRWPASARTSRDEPPVFASSRTARVMTVHFPECDEHPGIPGSA